MVCAPTLAPLDEIECGACGRARREVGIAWVVAQSIACIVVVVPCIVFQCAFLRGGFAGYITSGDYAIDGDRT